SGTITLDGGAFLLATSSGVSAASSLIIDGATLDLVGHNVAVANVQLTSGRIAGIGTLSSANAFDMRSGSVSANLGGSVGLIKTTSGTVTLSGANTYTGTTS